MVLKNHYDKVALDITIKILNNKIGEWIREIKLEQFDEIANLNHNKDELIKYILGA